VKFTIAYIITKTENDAVIVLMADWIGDRSYTRVVSV